MKGDKNFDDYWESTNKKHEGYKKENIKFLMLRNQYSDEFKIKYEKELYKAVSEIIPDQLLKDLGFDRDGLKNKKLEGFLWI
ncbi:MAG: hypothetical protein SVJ22_11745 [Halobacteriota archaeon]|nr:hypothetical protein [Halobacteriota archaeon]